MVERASHLVDAVIPEVPMRQWVLTLPHRLRYLLAWDHELCCAVLGVFVRAVLGFQRRRARKAGIADGRGGAITVIQRFASGLRLNVHGHVLMPDGVFHEEEHGTLGFFELPPPNDDELARLVASVRRRVLRLLDRRGVAGWRSDDEPNDGHEHGNEDPVERVAPALAPLLGASVQGLRALGPRAGAPVGRVGGDPRAGWVESRKAWHAHLDGFDLHAGIAVEADDRHGLERLARYLLRPAIAQDRLSWLEDGRVMVELKNAWSDGTTHLLFEPCELLARLATFVPRPRSNLILYYGVFAANSKWRARVVADVPIRQHDGVARLRDEPTCAPQADAYRDEASREAEASSTRRRNYRWSDLMRRAFGDDPLECPRCGTPMKLIALIESPSVVRAILDHLGLPSEPLELCPARAPPTWRQDADDSIAWWN